MIWEQIQLRDMTRCGPSATDDIQSAANSRAGRGSQVEPEVRRASSASLQQRLRKDRTLVRRPRSLPQQTLLPLVHSDLTKVLKVSPNFVSLTRACG